MPSSLVRIDGNQCPAVLGQDAASTGLPVPMLPHLVLRTQSLSSQLSLPSPVFMHSFRLFSPSIFAHDICSTHMVFIFFSNSHKVLEMSSHPPLLSLPISWKLCLCFLFGLMRALPPLEVFKR